MANNHLSLKQKDLVIQYVQSSTDLFKKEIDSLVEMGATIVNLKISNDSDSETSAVTCTLKLPYSVEEVDFTSVFGCKVGGTGGVILSAAEFKQICSLIKEGMPAAPSFGRAGT